MEIKDTLIQQIIDIGYSLLIADTPLLKEEILRGSFTNWGNNTIMEILDDQKLVFYFKGLVVIEKTKGSVGKVSPAIKVYREIIKRNLDINYTLGDWAYHFSDNDFIPYGFIHPEEESMQEYLIRRKDYIRRINMALKAKEENIKQKKERSKNLEKQRKEISKREKFNKIKYLPLKEQITLTITNDEHPLFTDLPIINKLLDKEVVDGVELNKLLIKLRKIESTSLYNKLTELLIFRISKLFYLQKKSNSQETLVKLEKIEKEVNEKVENILRTKNRGLGFCHLFWNTKKEYLKKNMGLTGYLQQSVIQM